MNIENLKTKPNLTRQDIAELLKSIGKPGENRDQKITAVANLERVNSQGHDIVSSLNTYEEF